MPDLAKGISLKAVAMFEVLAETGAIAETARRTGQSQPAVSQQLQRLEAALGAVLVTHDTRPMTLTNAGRTFLVRARESLRQLRLARTELDMLDLRHLSSLRIGIIEDFDSEITPALVTTLSQNLSNCHFRQVSAPSHDMVRLMDEGRLDMIVATATEPARGGRAEYPLLRDPFILVVPGDFPLDLDDPWPQLKTLPFLRHDGDMLISRQIEAQLSRAKIDLANRFEIGPIQSMMGLVASGAGWAISTPLSWQRAQRFQARIAVHPLPMPKFARRISLFARADWADRVPGDIAATLRAMLRQTVVREGLERLPWLGDSYRVID
jgi:DNA-binding transcriptional LysR family regulator